MRGRGITLPASLFFETIFRQGTSAGREAPTENCLKMLALSPAQREKHGKSGGKRPEMRNSGKLPWETVFCSLQAQPVDKVLNNFFTDWGQVEKLSSAGFLSKNCSSAIHGLPLCLSISQLPDFFPVNRVIHRNPAVLTITYYLYIHTYPKGRKPRNANARRRFAQKRRLSSEAFVLQKANFREGNQYAGQLQACRRNTLPGYLSLEVDRIGFLDDQVGSRLGHAGKDPSFRFFFPGQAGPFDLVGHFP